MEGFQGAEVLLRLPKAHADEAQRRASFEVKSAKSSALPDVVGEFYSVRVSDVYRSAASVLVLRAMKDHPERYEFLLLHKPRKNDAWQLPQGGVEHGETSVQAAFRELQEEAGITDRTFLGESKRVYKYDFPPSFRRFRPDNVCGQSIAYVFAEVPFDTPVRVDGNEVDDHVWIEPSALGSYVQRSEYASLVSALYAEATQLLRGAAS